MSVYAIQKIASALFEVPTGIFSDRIGRKKTIIYGSVASVVSVLLLALSTNYLMLGASAILLGLCQALFSGNNDAYLYEILAAKNLEGRYHEYSGKVGSMYKIALATSALLGGLIAFKSLHLAIWLTLIPQLICLIIATQLPETRIKRIETTNIYSHLLVSLKLFWTNKHLRLINIGHVLRYAIGDVEFFLRPAFYQLIWPVWAIGIAKTLEHGLSAFGRYNSGRIINKIGYYRILFLETFYSRFVSIVALLFPTLFSPIIISSTSLVSGSSRVAMESLMQHEFTRDQRATMGSINSLLGSILFSIVSVVLGFFADTIGPIKSLLILQFMLLGPVLFYWRLSRYKSR